MDKKRANQLLKMSLQQRRDLHERLIASLACAAYGLEQATEYRISGRPKGPETHDFNAKRKSGKKDLLAIEVTGFYGKEGVMDPKKMGFWVKLTDDIEAGLKGKLPGTFRLHGGSGQFPNIPGKKRGVWVQAVQQAIVSTAASLAMGEPTPLGSPPEVAEMQLEKLSDNGSQVDFWSTPITSGPLLPQKAVGDFCSTTLLEKNNGSLATAKAQGKKTMLAVLMAYPPDIAGGVATEIRSMYLNGDIPNINALYLINTWLSEVGTPMLIKVI